MTANQFEQAIRANDGLSADEWRRFYDLAVQVRAMAPWEWMDETDVFGVA